jgi:MFS transporter, ACS family, tartrate transporter
MCRPALSRHLVGLPKLCGASLLISTALVLYEVAASGIAPTFRALPYATLTGSAAAGGIALINPVGSLGGLLGPYMIGLVKDATGSFPIGLDGAGARS